VLAISFRAVLAVSLVLLVGLLGSRQREVHR
jgi:hypothetical protein